MSHWHIIFFLILTTISIFVVIKILNKYDEPPNFKEEIRLKKLKENRILKQTEELRKLEAINNFYNVKTSGDETISMQTFRSGFWHGQKGLALTFWGFFVGGNILFNAVTIIFSDNQTLIVINLILSVIWNVLAIMGVFNAANIYKAEKIKQGLPYTAATIAKVAAVLLILSAIGNNIPK